MSSSTSVITRLRHHLAFRVATIYAIGGWLLIQFADISLEAFNAPSWVMQWFLALVLAGMPFVFASGRNQKLGVRLFFGMTLGVVFTIVNRMMQNLGEAYGVTEVLTVIGPSVALAIAAMLVLRRSA